MSAFPSSALGLPQSLNYSLPPSMSENAKSYFASVSPDNLQEVVGSSGITALFAANGIPQVPFNQSNLYFSIPAAGSSPSLFLDPRETTLSFQLIITTGGTATVAAAGAQQAVQLISSAASWFDQLQLISNNLPIEMINNYGVLHHILLNNTVNSSEKQGPCSIMMGCDDSSFTQLGAANWTVTPAGLNGCSLPDGTTTNSTYSLNFCIPLVSMLGINGGDKLFPIGMLQNLQLMLTTTQYCPITSWFTTIPTAINSYTSIRLNNFRLGLKYVDIGEVAASMLLSSFSDGKLYLKNTTYMNSNVSLPAGSAGQQVLYSQVRASSVKSLFFHYGAQGFTGTCPNFQFDSVNPNISTWNTGINGIIYPQYNLLPIQWPALSFSHVAAAFGAAGNLKATGGSYTRSAYGICAIQQGAAGQPPTLPSPDFMISGAVNNCQRPNQWQGSTTTQYTPIANSPNSFLLAVDLERSGGTLFSGVNSRASGITQNVNIYSAPQLGTGGALANSTMTCYVYGLVDCVLVFDISSRSVMAFI